MGGSRGRRGSTAERVRAHPVAEESPAPIRSDRTFGHNGLACREGFSNYEYTKLTSGRQAVIQDMHMSMENAVSIHIYIAPFLL